MRFFCFLGQVLVADERQELVPFVNARQELDPIVNYEEGDFKKIILTDVLS